MSLEAEIMSLKERNRRVEADKAWELSWTRRLLIAAFTYLVAAVWLLVINDTMPYLKALVPVAGYLLSMLSVSAVKSWWIEHNLPK